MRKKNTQSDKVHKKDVLFLCQFFYPEYISTSTLPYDTAEALSRAGFSVDALCGYPKEYTTKSRLPKCETVSGVGIRRLKYIQLARKSKIGRLINYFSFTTAVLLNIFRLNHYRSLIVYTNPPLLPGIASLAKRLFGCKLVLVAYDLYPEMAINTQKITAGGAIAKLMRMINRHVYAKADRVVALSSEMKEFIEKNRPIAKDKVCVIPNWYKDVPSVIEHEHDPYFYETSKDKFIVSYLGNMGICQDMDTLLQAAKLLCDDESIHFLFAGHGNKVEAVKEFVKQENLTNVTVLGFLQGEAYEAALAASQLAMVSLVEGVCELCAPSKVYAYMMAGLPILTIMDKRANVARDALKNGFGINVANGDALGLAAQIKELSQNESLCREMGENARKVFLQKYEKEVCMNQYVDMMFDTMEDGSAHHLPADSDLHVSGAI